jgi:transcriptional regulator with XRE-family HTH domain
MKRGTKQQAEEMRQRVIDIARSEPRLGQKEIAGRLGISRSMVTWFLNRDHRLAIRKDQTLQRFKTGRRRLRRQAQYVAMRMTAVHAVQAAFPDMRSREIAEALEMDLGMVKYYMLRQVKSEHAKPSWADLLIDACRTLCSNRPAVAALKFQDLARVIDKPAEANQ